jgi:hypothetical protein
MSRDTSPLFRGRSIRCAIPGDRMVRPVVVLPPSLLPRIASCGANLRPRHRPGAHRPGAHRPSAARRSPKRRRPPRVAPGGLPRAEKHAEIRLEQGLHVRELAIDAMRDRGVTRFELTEGRNAIPSDWERRGARPPRCSWQLGFRVPSHQTGQHGVLSLDDPNGPRIHPYRGQEARSRYKVHFSTLQTAKVKRSKGLVRVKVATLVLAYLVAHSSCPRPGTRSSSSTSSRNDTSSWAPSAPTKAAPLDETSAPCSTGCGSIGSQPP